MEFIEECKSKDDLTQQSILAARFMDLLEQTGTDALIILEKKGKTMDILASDISEKAIINLEGRFGLGLSNWFDLPIDIISVKNSNISFLAGFAYRFGS